MAQDIVPTPDLVDQSAAFAHVDAWVFDLDNTLYPPDVDLFKEVGQRITTYVAALYGIDGLSAKALQMYMYQRYGTSLRGLMEEDGIDPHAFMDFVHDVNHGVLTENPLLRAAIEALPGKRYILTNGSVKHAEAVSRKLGLDDLFHGVFDVAAAGWTPKPKPEPYRIFLDRYGVEPTRAAMFEDMTKNLVVPHQLGMRTVLVVGKGGEAADHREPWEKIATKDAHVDVVVDDLAVFLDGLRVQRPAGAR
jgi:putative hydrolase of the HAD superfamily